MLQDLSPTDIVRLKKITQEIRLDILNMIVAAKSGHPGGSLSTVEIIVTLFFAIMNIDPKNPKWSERDCFHLSKGHGCPALYAVLAKRAYFPSEELKHLRQFGALLQGHPHPKTPGIEVASGSLGQGLSVSCGLALAKRLDKKQARIYTLLGDGELQEGQIWEAALFAAHYKLDNLCVIIDKNGMQIDGKTEDIINEEPLADKWQAFGFNVLTCDGHSVEELFDTIKKSKECKGKPTVVIANTVKGKGISFMEHNLDFHGKAPSNDETTQALGELKGTDK